MKRIISFIAIFSILFSQNYVFAENYLLNWKNYYEDNSIKKWFLDEIISQDNVNSPENGGDARWEMFQNAVNKNLVNYTPWMTYNEYFKANNISPEDAFKVSTNTSCDVQKILLPSGARLHSDVILKQCANNNGEIIDYITYVWPYKDRSAYWWDKNLESPILFSRLSIWNPFSGVINFSRNQYPIQIWYWESSTVNDYMLTSENDFRIPTRYNTKREDLYLTMRSAGFFGNSMKDARGFLSAENNWVAVEWSAENNKVYLDTTTKLLYTPFYPEQLWFLSRMLLNPWINRANNSLKNISVKKFSDTLKQGLSFIQSNSSVNDIKWWVGWQIQIIGFYRNSQIDNDFLSKEEDRKNDSINNIDVKYYMYTESSPADSTISTPLASNWKHLYSPNESVFKIETTRPYFKKFWNLEDEILFDENSFEEKLWENSFIIEEKWISPDGTKIATFLPRVKLRISEDWINFSDTKYSFEELKEELKKEENLLKTFKIAYTYAAVDADDKNIWNLPEEIEDNTWAYAIPFLRTVNIPSKIIVKYFDESDLAKEIWNFTIEEKTIFWKKWENYDLSSLKKDIPWYEFIKIEDGKTEKWQFAEWKEEISFIYKKIPEIWKIIIKYLDENGIEIEKQEEKVWEIGIDYKTEKKEISWYEFVKVDWEETWKFEKDDKNIIYNYKKKITQPQNPPKNGGSWPGGYVPDNSKNPLSPLPETTTKPIVSEDNQNIFKTGLVAGQCVSIIKNLDDQRLIEYYISKLDIKQGRRVHADVSRWEFMKMLFLASGLNLKNINTEKVLTMSDISLDNRYFQYIAAGLNYGIIHGQTNGNQNFFRPNDSITRAEAAKIFIRVANLSTSEYKNIFSDLNPSMSLAKYAESAYENCLLHGRKTRDGHPINGKPRVFEPNSPITIAETAKVLYNMIH